MMNLEPEISVFIERANTISACDTTPSIEEQRAEYDYYCSHFHPPHPPDISSSDQHIATPGVDVPVRWYRHESPDSNACVVYFHGGGFILGGLDSHDFLCARLCRDICCSVVAVDYRLAPEHIFPAAFDDCSNVLQALQREPERFGIDPNRIVLCGDSAGGNLAAATALANRDRDGAPLRGQVMIYPVLAADSSLPSYSECSHAPMLTTEDTQFYNQAYLGADVKPTVFSAPLLGEDVSGLPPALLLPVEYDPLRDDSFAYHQKLLDAGVQSTLYLGQGLVHGCMRAIDTSPGVQAMYQTMTGFIKDVTR